MSCEESIDIVAKGNGREAIVSIRQNELIRNLRALVAVRFEQAIARIVLVFAGEVLRDVGTIDGQGIISGVTVHVVCRPEQSQDGGGQAPTPGAKLPPVNLLERFFKSRSSAFFTHLLDEPGLLRTLLQSDPRIRSLLEENVMLRHYLNSDRNLRELLASAFSPAKEEMSRRRDLYILRMESVPGGHKLLGRLQVCMRQSYENNVAMTFQHPSLGSVDGTNPQRGFENRCPLPNPWERMATAADMDCAQNMAVSLRKKCRQVMKSLELGDIGKSLTAVRELGDSAVLARRILERRIRANQINATKPSASASTSGSSSGAAKAEEGTVKAGTSTATLRIKISNSRDVGYKTQMEQLQQMGYQNRVRNISALKISLGNVESAVRLLDHWNRSEEG
ncbi:hypothetical protein KR067_007918 [Drosophila pandora]|nr:hypothetical protein KR067_007918 [Drosophila pandora]